MGLAWGVTKMPVDWFNPGRTLFWERSGRFYEVAARWFGGGFAKRALAGKDRDYLHRFIREIRRGEFCHWCVLGCARLFFLWNRWWADLVMVSYELSANLPCILAQRYNRLRLQRVLARRSWPAFS